MTDILNAKTTESSTSIEAGTLITNTDYLTFIGGRKFTLSIVVVFATSLLCWFGKIDPGVFSVVVVSTVGAYTAGNVLQKVKA